MFCLQGVTLKLVCRTPLRIRINDLSIIEVEFSKIEMYMYMQFWEAHSMQIHLYEWYSLSISTLCLYCPFLRVITLKWNVKEN